MIILSSSNVSNVIAFVFDMATGQEIHGKMAYFVLCVVSGLCLLARCHNLQHVLGLGFSVSVGVCGALFAAPSRRCSKIS